MTVATRLSSPKSWQFTAWTELEKCSVPLGYGMIAVQCFVHRSSEHEERDCGQLALSGNSGETERLIAEMLLYL